MLIQFRYGFVIFHEFVDFGITLAIRIGHMESNCTGLHLNAHRTTNHRRLTLGDAFFVAVHRTFLALNAILEPDLAAAVIALGGRLEMLTNEIVLAGVGVELLAAG